MEPYFVEEPPDVETLEDLPVKFEAVVAGDPMPDVKWQFGAQDLINDPSEKYRQFYNNTTGRCHLIVSHVTKQDEGVYQCVIRNIHGSDEAEVELEVTTLSDIMNSSWQSTAPSPLRTLPLTTNQKPAFQQAPKSTYVVEKGGTLSVRCKVSGKPNPTVRWFDNRGQNLFTALGAKIVTSLSGEHELTITKCSQLLHQLSPLVCVAENTMGQIRATCHVRVSQKQPFEGLNQNPEASEKNLQIQVVNTTTPEAVTEMPQNDSPQHTSEPRVEQRELEHANSTSDISNLQQLTSRVPDEEDTLITTAMSDPSVSMTHHNITMTNLLQQMNEIITKPNPDPEETVTETSSPQQVTVTETELPDMPKSVIPENTGTTASGPHVAKNDWTVGVALRPLVISAEASIDSPYTPTMKEKLTKKAEKLKIVDNPRCFSAVDRETITLYCNFEGEVSSYEWLQDGKKIRNTADFKQYCTDDGFACLTIDDVLYPEDSGMYTCQLEGPDGSIISCNILLDVRKGVKAPVHRRKDRRMSTSDLNRMLAGIKGPPEFLIALPYQYDVIDGDEVTFKCKIEGSEPMTVEWLHPGGSPVPNNDDFRQDCQSTSTGDAKWVSLVLPDVFEEDAGLWSCKAINKYGIAKTKTLLNVSPATAPEEQTNTSTENLKNFDPEPFAFVTLPSIKKYSTPESSNNTFPNREPTKIAENTRNFKLPERDPNEPENTSDPELDAVSVVSIDDKDSETCVPFAMVTIRKTSVPIRSPSAVFSKATQRVFEKPDEVKKQVARRTQSVNPSDLSSMGTHSAKEDTSKDNEGPRSVKDLEGIPFAKVKIVNQSTDNGETLGQNTSEGLERSTSSIQVGSSSTVTDSEFSCQSETDESSADDSYRPTVRTQTSLRLNLANIENEDLSTLNPNAKTPTGIISRDIVTKSKISPQYLQPEGGPRNLKLENGKTKTFPERNSRYEIIEYLQSLPDSYFEEGQLSLYEICKAFQENRFSNPYRTSTSPIPEEQVTFERAETSADVVEFANTTEISRNKPLKVSSNSIESLGQVISVTDENKQTFPANIAKPKQGNQVSSNAEVANRTPQLLTQTETQQQSTVESCERKPKSKLTRSQSNTVTSTESVNSGTKTTNKTCARTKSPGKIPTLSITTKRPVKQEKQSSNLKVNMPTNKPESSGTSAGPKTPTKTETKLSDSNSSIRKPASKLRIPSTRSPATGSQTGELTVDICNKHKSPKSLNSPKLSLHGEKSSPKSPNTRSPRTRPREDSIPTTKLSKVKSSEKVSTSQMDTNPNHVSDTGASSGMADLSNIMSNIGLLMKSQENPDSMDGEGSPRDLDNPNILESTLSEGAQANESSQSTFSKPEPFKDSENVNATDHTMDNQVSRFDPRRKTKSRAKFERAQTLTHSIPAEAVSSEDSYQDEAPYVLGNTSVYHQAPYGEAMQMTCIIMGKPTPDIVWYKDGRLVNSTRRKPSVKANKQLLDIDTTIHADAGIYECKGTNNLGECAVKFSVQIVDEFSFTQKPTSQYTAPTQTDGNVQTNLHDSSLNDDQLGEELFSKFSHDQTFLSKRDSYDTFEALEQNVDKLDDEQIMNLLMQETATSHSGHMPGQGVPTTSQSNLDLKPDELVPHEYRSVLKNKIKPHEPTLVLSNSKQNDMRGNLKTVINDEGADSITSEPNETKDFRDTLHTHVQPSKPTKKTIPTTCSAAKEGLKNKVPLKLESDKKFESKKLDYRQQLQPLTSSIEAKKQISKLEEKPEKQINKPLNPVRRKSVLDERKPTESSTTLLEARVGLRRAPATPAESKDAKSKIPQIPRKRSQQN